MRWNHNVHYGRQLLRVVPAHAADALDVGCGEGWLVRELHGVVGHVVGIDPEGGCIAAAQAHGTFDGVEYIEGDFLAYPFDAASFDFITAVASLHHMDEATAVRRMAELLRPEGVLGIVGLARSRTPADFAYDLAGAFTSRAQKLANTYWETPAPKIWPPAHTYGQLKRLFEGTLPGCRFQRQTMWRYLLTWTKPANQPAGARNSNRL